MTVYFGSSEDIDFLLNGSIERSTDNTDFDPNYARNSLGCNSGGDNINATSATALGDGTEFYCSWIWVSNTATAYFSAMATFFSGGSGGTPVMKLDRGANTLAAFTWDGGWVDRGQLSGLPSFGNLNRFTVKGIMHATTGEFTVWIGNNQVAQFIGDTLTDTGVTDIDTAQFRRPHNIGEIQISEVIIADEQTINMRCATLVPNGNGNQSEWTGDFTNVDEITDSAGDVLRTAIDDNVEMMEATDYGGDVNLVVIAVSVTAQAVRGASGPQNLQIGVREGSSEVFSANKALTAVYTPYNEKFLVNPDTGIAWTVAELDTLESGVKSIT